MSTSYISAPDHHVVAVFGSEFAPALVARLALLEMTLDLLPLRIDVKQGRGPLESSKVLV